MNTYLKKLLLVILSCCPAFADVDQNPVNTGSTQVRNALGRTFEAAYHNPAILGVDRTPRGGMILPLSNIGVGAWSDKLALSPFNRYWVEDLEEGSALATKILKNSFDLDDLSPEEVSDVLTKEFKGGVSMYSGVRNSIISGAWKRIAFDITTHFDEEVHIPEGPLYAIFSRDKGLIRGNELDFKSFRQDAIWATDFTLHLGLPVTIPALHNLFRLRYGAGGIGLKYVMGHSVLKATTEEGTLRYNENANVLDVNGKVKIQTAGFGFYGPWKMDRTWQSGHLPVSGHGVGVDLGGILYDTHGTLSINVENLGILFWMKNVKSVTYQIRKDNLDAYDIIDGIEEARKNDEDPKMLIFNQEEQSYISTSDDVLKESSSFPTILPVALNIGYAYSWDFKKNGSTQTRGFFDHANAGVNYEQQLTRGPGRSFTPRLSIGGEIGALEGILPVRAGFVFGGSERIASALGLGINLRYFAINASYKAIGHAFFVPKRGVELAGGLSFNWGMSMDSDKDGISDKDDKCPAVPEDIDSFEDEDGCPETDNDKDGIMDSADKCINVPEDKDNFEDSDGCPDLDNDNDQITDSLDKCPDEPEDKDNFNDTDGCPDLDNDADGVMDVNDKCPMIAEDIDLFEDKDGCPDFDNDHDGIPDSSDICLNEPETFNGYKDTDGCPDTLIKPTEKETKTLNTKLRAINFKTGSAELTDASFTALDYIGEFLKLYPYLRYEIQGHTDNVGSDDYNLILSAARSSTVRTYLLSKGIPDSNLIAIGYGETMPVAENTTVSGKALNRRVEFKVIETNDEYSILRVRQEQFREQVKAAKIKGAK